MLRFVLDNSVCMRWLFADGSDADRCYAEQILSVLERDDSEAVVPGIWPLEVANVIARAEARAGLPEARSAEFLGALGDMNIRVDTDTVTHALHDTLNLARRFRLSAYDAAYLELALRQALPLATRDHDMMRALQAVGGQLL